ncbi:hypothetical protein FAZ95_38915 [Trinickia violacea]|uniref:DUF2063 domain-containing protein n=1 Tax=Trinickia violacea TaxID=2571746 RepID=A0A4P8J3J6_9BURK|nr:hypothetical protein [Trinickia violacea]QCP55105.1 hypothetical protein FAZ95_38915 [Trinickia violacea]
MNPQTVWHVWRRILREPDLQHALFAAGESAPDLSDFALNKDECEAALAYARQSDRAMWFVTNYRFRLANSFLNALETGAPLTLRAILRRGADIQTLSHAFLDRHAWKDYGPYVHAYCHDALRFLSEQQDVMAIAGMAELIAFERDTVAWLIALDAMPSSATADGLLAGVIERTRFARYHRSSMRLSAWLRDKTLLGKVPLEAGIEHYLVYLPNPQGAVRFALIPPRAAAIYDALDEARSRAVLPDVLRARGHAMHTSQDDECLAMLARYHAIRISTGGEAS